MKSLLAFVRKHKAVLLSLFLIFLLGFFLRSYRISEFMYWGDPGRDSLVAKYIVDRGKPIYLMPLAAGGNGQLLNSPFYYNFLAFLWLFFPSAEGLAFAFILINSLVIIVNFFIGKELDDENLGLMLAFMTAITTLFITHSRSSFQPFLIPLPFSLSILFLVRFQKFKDFFSLVMMTLFFWFCFHIHYSIIPVSIVFFFINIYSIYQFWKTHKDLLFTLISILVFFNNLFLWYLLTNYSKSIDLFNFILSTIDNSKNNLSINFSQLFVVTKYFFESPDLFSISIANLALIIILFIFPLFLIKQRNNIKTFPIRRIWLLFSSILFLLVFEVSKSNTSYLMPYYYLFIILITFIIYQLSKRNRLVFSFIFFIFAFSFQKENIKFSDIYPFDEFGQSRYLVSNIINDIERYDLSKDDYQIMEKTKGIPVFNWNSSSYWYFLDEHYQTSFLRLSSGFNNLKPVFPNPKVIYLVCREFEDDTLEFIQDNCLNPTIKRLLDMNSDIEYELSTLIDKDDPKTNLELYKIEFSEKLENSPWYIYYKLSK